MFESPYPLCFHAEDDSVPIAKICIRNDECWHCEFDQWLDALPKDPKAEEGPEIWRDVLIKAA